MAKAQFTNTDTTVRMAKEGVDMSVRRFENALEQLATKVDDAAHKIQDVKEIANKPREIYNTIRDRANMAVDTVRANPTPYIVVAAGILGAVGLVLWARSRDYEFNIPFNTRNFET